jgi:hypothetical protein
MTAASYTRRPPADQRAISGYCDQVASLFSNALLTELPVTEPLRRCIPSLPDHVSLRA